MHFRPFLTTTYFNLPANRMSVYLHMVPETEVVS